MTTTALDKRSDFVLGQVGVYLHATIAALYTLIVTAKVNRLDPYAHLVHIARRMPAAQSLDDLEKLLPWNLTP